MRSCAFSYNANAEEPSVENAFIQDYQSEYIQAEYLQCEQVSNSTPEVDQHSMLRHRWRQRLIETNYEAAIKVGFNILRGWGSYMEAEELKSVVNVALAKASWSFVPTRNCSFLTYAYYTIKSELRTQIDFFTRNQKIGVSKSINSLAENEISFTAHNTLAVFLSPEVCLQNKEISCHISAMLQRLSEIERSVITKYFWDGQEIEQIADDLNYSKRHLFRLKNKALLKIRGYLELHGIG